MTSEPCVLPTMESLVTEEIPATVELGTTMEMPPAFSLRHGSYIEGPAGHVADELVGVLGGLATRGRIANALAWSLLALAFVAVVVMLRLLLSLVILVAS